MYGFIRYIQICDRDPATLCRYQTPNQAPQRGFSQSRRPPLLHLNAVTFNFGRGKINDTVKVNLYPKPY
ncbi:MAG TPA: hypothetical protein V6D28_24065 [Leptolyngbyaceae cyanobacterium]